MDGHLVEGCAGVTQTIKFRLSDTDTTGLLPISLGSGGAAFDPKTYSSVWSGLGNFGIKIAGSITYDTTEGPLVFKFR